MSAKPETPAKRKQGGSPTTNLILSARVCGNSEMFPEILDLHVPSGAVVADVTFGKGVFWRNVDQGRYTLKSSDISTGVDCRRLPYEDGTIDAVVLDPPYIENSDNTAFQTGHSAMSKYYGLTTVKNGKTRYQGGILELYIDASREAMRVIRPGGVLIVKCQDEVCANKQKLTHIDIVNSLVGMGFYAKDLFVTVRHNRPVVSRMKKQVHARKNHSYFLIFQKTKTKTPSSK